MAHLAIRRSCPAIFDTLLSRKPSGPRHRFPEAVSFDAGPLTGGDCPGARAADRAPGYLAVGNIGRPRATLAAMRRAVLTIRRLLRGESVAFNGVETWLRNVSDPSTPALMTAAGPRMVELAGEVADGALLLVSLHPKAVNAARRRLDIGAARSLRAQRGNLVGARIIAASTAWSRALALVRRPGGFGIGGCGPEHKVCRGSWSR